MRLGTGIRTRAALCHLCLFLGVTVFIAPFIIAYPDSEDPEFLENHRNGALCYQIFALVTSAFLVLLTVMVPPLLFDDFNYRVVMGFSWVALLCYLGLLLAGAVYLSTQAWSGLGFDLGFLNRFVYDEPSSN